MFVFNIFLFSIIVIPYAVLYIRRYKLTPVSIFLIMEMSYFYGICAAPRGRDDVAVKLETLYVVANACFILGVEFWKHVKIGDRPTIEKPFVDGDITLNQRITIWVIVGVSVLLCTYFFASSGINVFYRSLVNFFNDSNENLKNERAGFFSVRGVGYIYQFRAVLLPILAFFIAFVDKHKAPLVLRIGLFALMVLFLLGTGQRNAFVFVSFVFILYSILLHTHYRIKIMSRIQTYLFIAAGVLFLVILTISNGRVASGEGQVGNALVSLLDRVFQVNQRTAINAFSYIDTQPCSWGYDWLMTMKDILPGKSGYMTVSRITFYLAYGNYNGTGDPCLWGSAWYNFSILGVTLFPFLLGCCYHNAYKTMLKKENKDRLYLLLYVAICVYLGLWNYGTPMNLLNYGAVACFLLRWILFRLLKPEKAQAVGSRPAGEQEREGEKPND